MAEFFTGSFFHRQLFGIRLLQENPTVLGVGYEAEQVPTGAHL